MVLAPVISASRCAWLSSSNSTTRPSGLLSTGTLTQRRYHISDRHSSLFWALYQRDSSTDQPRPSVHALRRPVDVPPSSKPMADSVHSAEPCTPNPSIRSLCFGNTSAIRSGRIHLCLRSQRADSRSGDVSCISHEISLRLTAVQRYGNLNGSLSRLTSTQPRPMAACGRKASEHARSALLSRSASLSRLLMASATSCPPVPPAAVTRQSVRVVAS